MSNRDIFVNVKSDCEKKSSMWVIMFRMLEQEQNAIEQHRKNGNIDRLMQEENRK